MINAKESRIRIPETYDRILKEVSNTLRAEHTISGISEALKMSYANVHACIMDMVDDKMVIIHRGITAGDPEWIDDAFIRITTRGQRLILEEGGYKQLAKIQRKSESQSRLFRWGTIVNATLIILLGAWQAFETSDSKHEEQRDVNQDISLTKQDEKLINQDVKLIALKEEMKLIKMDMDSLKQVLTKFEK